MSFPAMRPGNDPAFLRVDEDGNLIVKLAEPAVPQSISSAFGQKLVTVNSTITPVTAAADPDLGSSADFIQVTGIWNPVPSGYNHLITQQDNSLTVQRAGIYRIELWATVESTENRHAVGFRHATNGVISLSRTPILLLRNIEERQSVAAFGILELQPGDDVSLWVAADKTGDLTITDAVFTIHELYTGTLPT